MMCRIHIVVNTVSRSTPQSRGEAHALATSRAPKRARKVAA